MRRSCSIALVLVACGSLARAQHAARGRPLTCADAIVRVDEVRGEVRRIERTDGGAADELAVQRLSTKIRARIDAVSLRDGSTLRTIWEEGDETAELVSWEVAGDLDGDGRRDLLVGTRTGLCPRHCVGAVVAISSATGAVLHRSAGGAPHDHYGASIALLGDVDRDGVEDYAVGAPQMDPRAKLSDDFFVCDRGHSVTRRPGGVIDTTARVSLGPGGPTLSDDEFWKLDAWGDELAKQSEHPGFVSARSGRDGKELWRTSGFRAGHAFGTSVRRAGDWSFDDHAEILVLAHARSREPATILDGRSGEVLDRFAHRAGLVEPIGDVDGDFRPDLALGWGSEATSNWPLGDVSMVSSATHRVCFELPVVPWSNSTRVTALGDLDADGHDEIALADPDYHLGGPGDPGWKDVPAIDVRTLGIAAATELENSAWCAFTYESGRVVIYSGRTHQPIAGVWGEPGGRSGLGRQVLLLSDLDEDGRRELLVRDGSTAFVFAGAQLVE